MENKNLIANDIPIKHPDEDLLNYHPFAKKIQKIIQGYANNPEPLTIGIYGKWGSGKSSLLGLIEKHIEIFHKEKDDNRYIKFHYNPWIYQTKEEMLFDFFDILSQKLGNTGNTNLKKAGKFIKKYSSYLKAVKLSASAGVPKMFNAGISIEPHQILKKIGEDLDGDNKNLNELKKTINDLLNLSDRKIIVFIDDVDRLDKDEIFTLFKLIKVNADFKNLIFIVCLDPNYVAKAIHHRYGDSIESGKEFLEKIINIPLELPLVEDVDLDFFVKEKLKPVLSLKKIKETDLEELYNRLKGSYFSSPREVLRIVNSFAVSLFAIGDEVNLHDLFWIEYIKIKYSKTYQAIKEYAGSFKRKTTLIHTINFNQTYAEQKNETGFRKELMENHKEAYPIIDFLFPLNRTGTVSAYQTPKLKPNHILDAELRINHTSHFEKYFSFHIKGKISELSFSNLKARISNDETTVAYEALMELIKDSGERKTVYRITSEIEVLNPEIQSDFFKFLIKNLKMFSEVSDLHPHSIEIVRSIAKKLAQNIKVNKELILSIAKSLDYIHTCWYLGILLYDEYEIPYRNDLEELLIEKVKATADHPFFKNRNIAKMIMGLWSSVKQTDFEKYILKYLNSQENIFLFIVSFPHLWNRTINGTFKDEDFDYVVNDLRLNSKLIFEKMKELIPEIEEITASQEIEVSWDEHGNNTPLNNVKQFVYWHLMREEIG